MSYNCDHSVDYKVELTLPEDFDISDWCNWGDLDYSLKHKTFEITLGEDSYIKGTIKKEDHTLIATEVHVHGEGSGHAYEVIANIFVHYKGTLHLLGFWERGDSVDVLIIEEGKKSVIKVKEEDIYNAAYLKYQRGREEAIDNN